MCAVHADIFSVCDKNDTLFQPLIQAFQLLLQKLWALVPHGQLLDHSLLTFHMHLGVDVSPRVEDGNLIAFYDRSFLNNW